MDSGWEALSLGKTECWVQMKLYPKPNTFSEVLSKFLKSTTNFQKTKKNNAAHKWLISEIIDCKKRG